MDISMKKMGWEVKSFEKIAWITPCYRYWSVHSSSKFHWCLKAHDSTSCGAAQIAEDFGGHWKGSKGKQSSDNPPTILSVPSVTGCKNELTAG